MSSYESFPAYPEKNHKLTGLLIGGLILLVAIIVVTVIIVETRKKKQPASTSPSSSLAVSSTGIIQHLKGSGLPQNGYYATLGDGNDASFWGVQGGPTARPDSIKPNEPLLGEIRRERYNFREHISNRANTNSYSYPNTNGWWARSSYASQVRLEPGQWPKVSSTFAKPWRSDAGFCGPNNPCPYGSKNNSGTIVQAFGKLTRRGVCLPSGKCDCPLGMDNSGGGCQGTAARDFAGNLIWSRSELAAPISDVANLMDTDQKFETSELVSGIGGGI